MAVIDDVEAVCTRLASDSGWHALFLHHGLDIKARPLAAELSKTLSVDRTLKGFEDFSLTGQRGIEAGKPARSLLFHALASPNVLKGPDGKAFSLFPTAAEIETVLNYVYGSRLPSMTDLQQQAGTGTPLGIVVFAVEYRPRPDTGHKKHADLCFSRTGIARVGTAPPHYDRARRGFLPWVTSNPRAIRVIPARYSAYIAMQKAGDSLEFGPWPAQSGDDARQFWVPLHKLFDGPDCIAGLDLKLKMDFFQINEKLRQFHRNFPGSGWGEPDISNEPFVITRNLVKWADPKVYGSGLLTPVAKTHLVEEARYKGERLFFSIPQAPDYQGYIINRRFKQNDDGSVHDLSTERDVQAIVDAGGYNALHFIDHTADGQVSATCPALDTARLSHWPAYSLVSAPCFYPLHTPRRLHEWSLGQRFPQVFFGQSLRVLADRRMAGNTRLPGGHFPVQDKSIAAIISHTLDTGEPATTVAVAHQQRQTCLTDGGAGTLSPGWDIAPKFGSGFNPDSFDASVLGSPWTDDMKICDATGAYWPVLSADSSRNYAPREDGIAIIPLQNEEQFACDGVNTPRLIDVDNVRRVEYESYDHVDLTRNALDNRISVSLLAQTTAEDYQARILSMHNAFGALGAITRQEKKRWSVLLFQKVRRPDKELDQAESTTGTRLEAPVHAYQIYRNNIDGTTIPEDFTKRHAEVLEMFYLFVSPTTLLIKREQDPWQARYLVHP
ncbi:hypothetical protein [Pseudomonas izuensis]|uniref:Uncharacterized protein n=1 Tax=Pseudomonas izuensis TaxID=2684212 RepID=A0ABM7RSE7_9PSED|nr:hypothetical protein [Pseudomonas izuensis]BCX68039.1 hypothetical protein LAB08_R26790 [Pseudomonas izuensis]